ncbi:ATP synthase subunit C [Photobacterium sp. BZF1]|uniref:V-type ATP synthase subunit K n=1 Tax=Photobacterium rosenbergii TaxID=294936 RepID=A0A2T3MUP7_9GAMM|nr:MULTISPECIES: ATP synthase subunit C [Photobacterium]MBC7001948.1 ATP synthase subunit C [Photobacterium sp. BZF1]MBY5945453.1 ATP synthase subunit C [Photobacterium rosenbergii]PSW03579.1 V-type ATP synthase subunit K [Photobacterium rosenbergii]WEM41395.1 ATP synthase subunit C [Photobacterium sp. DA100]
MEQFVIALGWLGAFAPVALGAIGSAIGCSVAGQAACGAMLDVESGYGKYIGLSAMPSSQVIYGIVIMFTLAGIGVDAETAGGLFGVGLMTGLALLFSAIYQGQAVSAAINASKNKPEVFGLSIAPAAIVEGFSVFAFVFALVMGANIGA